MSRGDALGSGKTGEQGVPDESRGMSEAHHPSVPRPVIEGERPRADQVLWAVPKLALTPAAKFLLLAAWTCESDHEFHSISAANATLADWSGLSEKSVRNAKKEASSDGNMWSSCTTARVRTT